MNKYNMLLTGTIALSCNLSVPDLQASNDKKQPNILFIIADDASFAHFGANGSKWIKTPGFDRIASEGINFVNCYTPNAKSAPSRTTLLTGLYSWQAGAAGNHNPIFPIDLKVVTDALAENGYTIAHTGKGWGPGDPGTIDGRKRELTGTPFQKFKKQVPASGINKTDYIANFKEFLKKQDSENPWFFWFGCYEPHRNYEFGSGARLRNSSLNSIADFPGYWPDNEITRNDLMDYAYEVEYFDEQIAKFTQELEKRDELENTIIFVTSDHGMPFPRSKGNSYEESCHVPFAAMWKNNIKNPGRKVYDFVNFIDFTPSFLELAGIEEKDSGMKPSQGKSFVTHFDKDSKKTEPSNYVILGRERHDYGRPLNQGYPIRSIIQDGLLYICNLKPHLMPAGNPETGYTDCDASPTKSEILRMKREGVDSSYYNLCFSVREGEELYDLKTDRNCLKNLSENPIYLKKKKHLQKLLFKDLRSQNDPRMTDDGDVFDHYPYSLKNADNFYENVINGVIPNPWDYTKWINPTDYIQYRQ